MMSLKQQQAKMNWALQEICITLGSEVMKEKKAKQNFCSCILNAYSPGCGNRLFNVLQCEVFRALLFNLKKAPFPSLLAALNLSISFFLLSTMALGRSAKIPIPESLYILALKKKKCSRSG